MRIIAGAFKGRRLAAPRSQDVRPTSDKLRETLFNVIASRVPEARVLDLFAGTGALGLEALSRGARHVTFVERDPAAIALIAENVARCEATDRCAIIRGSVERAAKRMGGEFDLVLADPPYTCTSAGQLVGSFASLLAPGGLLVLEHARRAGAPEHLGNLTRTRTVVSGESALALYWRAAPDAASDEHAD